MSTSDHNHSHLSHDHAGHHEDHSHSATDAHGHGAAAGEIAECPVMAGSTVLKADAEAAGLVRDFEGTRYYLCCAACGPLFDADPAKYASAA
ncbi:hypothetical protein [Agrococcus baldri]|uniref:YHS domain-containing protein n=1 Tax=Agrococcus baldri TaxID=153730 RepID=A0AA87RCL1_9MICO|nr:hypothetical protein [Agrococcus baldri]GEK80600.1 hypothetical protein ABA31_19510 [Agrococcus baldri]